MSRRFRGSTPVLIALALVFASCAPKPMTTVPAVKRPLVLGMHAITETDADARTLIGEIPALAKRGVNLLIAEVDYWYDYASHPELRMENPVKKETVKALLAACRGQGHPARAPVPEPRPPVLGREDVPASRQVPPARRIARANTPATRERSLGHRILLPELVPAPPGPLAHHQRSLRRAHRRLRGRRPPRRHGRGLHHRRRRLPALRREDRRASSSPGRSIDAYDHIVRKTRQGDDDVGRPAPRRQGHGLRRVGGVDERDEHGHRHDPQGHHHVRLALRAEVPAPGDAQVDLPFGPDLRRTRASGCCRRASATSKLSGGSSTNRWPSRPTRSSAISARSGTPSLRASTRGCPSSRPPRRRSRGPRPEADRAPPVRHGHFAVVIRFRRLSSSSPFSQGPAAPHK